MSRFLAPLAVAVMAGVSACSDGASSDAVALPDDAILLDVRTPEEFAAGHLDGAQLLDFSGGQFEQALPSLDPEGDYYLYCRSGNRSGQATALMQDQGFASVTDLGSMDNASNVTGLDVVTSE